MLMNSFEILEYLKSESSEKYKANVVKMGIPEAYSIGISTTILRKLAKQLDKSNELAFELWNTHYHEARLLAVLLFNKKEITYEDIDKMMFLFLIGYLLPMYIKDVLLLL